MILVGMGLEQEARLAGTPIKPWTAMERAHSEIDAFLVGDVS